MAPVIKISGYNSVINQLRIKMNFNTRLHAASENPEEMMKENFSAFTRTKDFSFTLKRQACLFEWPAFRTTVYFSLIGGKWHIDVNNNAMDAVENIHHIDYSASHRTDAMARRARTSKALIQIYDIQQFDIDLCFALDRIRKALV